MTLEERAKRYADEHTTYTDFAGEENAIAHIDVSIEQAYIEGAKGQWHDLRKDPNDLPKEEKDFLIYTKEWGIEIRNYFSDDKYFSCRRNMVIAWCEIPTFDKE